jgi:hypothetical protein
MVEAGCHVRLCCAVRAKLIGDDPLGNKAIAFHQRHQQALGSLFISSLLHDFLENGAMLIDRTPKPEYCSSAFHNRFVHMPSIAWARLSPPQVASDLRSELGDPAADGLIRNVDTTLKKYFLNFTQAQIKP